MTEKKRENEKKSVTSLKTEKKLGEFYSKKTK